MKIRPVYFSLILVAAAGILESANMLKLGGVNK
jgi:hypothetical protein